MASEKPANKEWNYKWIFRICAILAAINIALEGYLNPRNVSLLVVCILLCVYYHPKSPPKKDESKKG